VIVGLRLGRNAQAPLHSLAIALWTFHGFAVKNQRLEVVVALPASVFVEGHGTIS
jgi:hypothetical protein